MTTHTDLIARLREDEENCHENAGEAADALESLEQQVAAQQAQMYADRKQALVWRDQVAALTQKLENMTGANMLNANALRLNQNKLGAAQADNARLRDVMEEAVQYAYIHGASHQVAMYKTALATPLEDSALQAALKAERERCAKLVGSCWDDSCCLEGSPMLHNLAAAIRGLA